MEQASAKHNRSEVKIQQGGHGCALIVQYIETIVEGFQANYNISISIDLVIIIIVPLLIYSKKLYVVEYCVLPKSRFRFYC